MTQLCWTTYNFPSFTHTTGMTHFLKHCHRLIKLILFKVLLNFLTHSYSDSHVISHAFRCRHVTMFTADKVALEHSFPSDSVFLCHYHFTGVQDLFILLTPTLQNLSKWQRRWTPCFKKKFLNFHNLEITGQSSVCVPTVCQHVIVIWQLLINFIKKSETPKRKWCSFAQHVNIQDLI